MLNQLFYEINNTRNVPGEVKVDFPRELKEEEYYRVEYNLPWNETLKEILSLESTGGPCSVCRKMWKRVDMAVKFERKIVTGVYYVPSCFCFGKCPVCKNNLYRDQAEVGEGKCLKCGWKKYKKKNVDSAYKF